jgi:hypothetical protein
LAWTAVAVLVAVIAVIHLTGGGLGMH